MQKLFLTFILVVLGLFIFTSPQTSFAADAKNNKETSVSEMESVTDASKNESDIRGIFKGYFDKLGGFDIAIWFMGLAMFVWQAFFLISYLFRKYWATQNAKIISELNLAVCEVFPLLGLLGTVLGLLNTFSALPDGNMADMSNVIKDLLPKFAPALTTTVSGMLAMIFNLMLCVVSWFCIQFITQEEK